MKYLSLIKQPKVICLIYLILLTIGATISRSINQGNILFHIIFNFFILLSLCTYIPWLISFFNTNSKSNKLSIIDSNIITLILFLILDPSNNFIITILIASLVTISRMFIRKNQLPIFNPSAFGIAMTAIFIQLINIFGLNILLPFVSWWGVSFSPRFVFIDKLSIAIFLTIPFGIYLAYKLRKLVIFFLALVLSFLLLKLANEFSLIHNTSLIYIFLEGTFLFAILIMLTEPKSSPIKRHEQIIYAISFCIFWIMFTLLKTNFELIYSIILSNAIYFLLKEIYSYKKRNKF